MVPVLMAARTCALLRPPQFAPEVTECGHILGIAGDITRSGELAGALDAVAATGQPVADIVRQALQQYLHGSEPPTRPAADGWPPEIAVRLMPLEATVSPLAATGSQPGRQSPTPRTRRNCRRPRSQPMTAAGAVPSAASLQRHGQDAHAAAGLALSGLRARASSGEPAGPAGTRPDAGISSLSRAPPPRPTRETCPRLPAPPAPASA